MLSEIMLQIYAAVLPPLALVLGAVVARIIAGLFRVLKDRWGVEIEGYHRDALQSAIMTGVMAALTRGLRGKEAIAAAIEHALKAGAPDAINFFNLGMADLERLAESRLQQQWPGFELGRAVADLNVKDLPAIIPAASGLAGR